MKVLSAAATLAVVFAERPAIQQHEVQKEHSSQGEPLGICCLKAKDYTDENGGRKKELFVDWVSVSKPNFNPSKECLLTSTVPADGGYFQDQTVGFGEKKVWPTVVAGHDADEACAQMMERYPLYHDEIIKQANADKVVDDKFRENENKKLDATHNAQMYEIHQKYKTKIAQEASDVGKASAQLIQNFMKDETADAKKLKDDITRSMKDLEQKDKTLAHKDRPADDIQFANEIQAASESTSNVVFQMVADHNQTLMTYVETATSEVINQMSQFKTTSSSLNTERTRDENNQKNITAAEKARMEQQAEDESERIRQLEAAKAAKAPTAPSLGDPVCTTKECCCTIRFKEGQAMDVKVATNFLNWDQCQFAGEAPTRFWISQCPSYMTECQKCAERSQCHNDVRRGCKVVAQESLDLKPKEIESIQPVLDVHKESASAVSVAETVAAPPAVAGADVAQETVQSSLQKESAAPVAEPVATPPAVAIADAPQEIVQSSSQKESPASIAEPVATPPSVASADAAQETSPIAEPVATSPAVASSDGA